MTDATTDGKQCPDCGETVKAAALICRFCRHDFRTDVSPVSEQPRSEPRRRGHVISLLAMAVGLAIVVLGAFVLLNARSELQDSKQELTQLEERTDDTRSALQSAEAESAALSDELEGLQEGNAALRKKIRNASAIGAEDLAAAEASPEEIVLAFQTASQEGDWERASALGDEGPIREWFGVQEFNEAEFNGCSGDGGLYACVFGENFCISVEQQADGYWITGVYGCDTP